MSNRENDLPSQNKGNEFKQASAGPGFVKQDRDREIFPFIPVNEIGTGNYIS